jgi:ABC-type lipoprotein release transport system permease subunit
VEVEVIGRQLPGGSPADANRCQSRSRAATWAYLVFSWRTRWRSLLVIALMVALTGGATIAAVAGARRSATAFERFDDEARTFDVVVSDASFEPEPPAMQALLHGPLVEEFNDVASLGNDSSIAGDFYVPMSRRGLDIERGVLIDGRRPDPDDPHEVVLTDLTSEQYGLRVGDTFELGTFAPADVPWPRMRVVGIVRNGFTLPTQATPGITIATPAFMEAYGDGFVFTSIIHMVRLIDEPDAVERFTDGVATAYGQQRLPDIRVAQAEEFVSDSISVITAALVAVALVIAVAGVAWVVAGVARDQRGASIDIGVLRALGSTPGQQRALLVGMVAPALAVGPVLAVVVAAGLSPLLSVGLARRLDPDPGLRADWTVLLIGAAALAVVVVASASITAWRLVDVSGRAPAAPKVPRTVDRAARALPPAPGTGVRFALHGRRRFGAQVGSALVGAVIGVVGLVAVAVVWSSMQRLVDTPARWGTTWDAAIWVEPGPGSLTAETAEELVDDADIDAAAVLVHGAPVTVDGVVVDAMTLNTLKGDLGPAVIEGREPRTADEIALGRDTLEAVDVPIGASVTVGTPTRAAEELRVVGVIAYPTIIAAGPTSVALGAVLSGEGGDRLLVRDASLIPGVRYIVVRWAPGVDEEAALERLTDGGSTVLLPTQPPEVAGDVLLPTQPPEIEGLRDVRGFPLVAAGALVVLGVVATIHALLLSVRRRHHELGVLSALGFTPAMRATVIATQATTLACVALVIGVPLGLLVGRATWAAIAGEIGLADDPMTPIGLLAAGAAALVLVLNAFATVPAKSAYRLRAAQALRSE